MGDYFFILTKVTQNCKCFSENLTSNPKKSILRYLNFELVSGMLMLPSSTEITLLYQRINKAFLRGEKQNKQSDCSQNPT